MIVEITEPSLVQVAWCVFIIYNPYLAKLWISTVYIFPGQVKYDMDMIGSPQDHGCYAGQGRVRWLGWCSPGQQGIQPLHRFLKTVPNKETDVSGPQGMMWAMCVSPILRDEMFPVPLGRKVISILTENLLLVCWEVCLGSERSCCEGNKGMSIIHPVAQSSWHRSSSITWVRIEHLAHTYNQ